MGFTTVNIEKEKGNPYKKEYNSKALAEKIETGTHKEILRWIKDEKLCLQSYDADTDKTLMRQILKEAGNGDEIIKTILNSYVTQADPGAKLTSNSYGVKLDFSGITSENKHGKQESVLTDLVELWLSYQNDPWDFILNPVKWAIQMCKDEKPEKVRGSPKLFLGKIKTLFCSRKSKIIKFRLALSSTSGRFYQAQVEESYEILHHSHSSVPPLPHHLLLLHPKYL